MVILQSWLGVTTFSGQCFYLFAFHVDTMKVKDLENLESIVVLQSATSNKPESKIKHVFAVGTVSKHYECHHSQSKNQHDDCFQAKRRIHCISFITSYLLTSVAFISAVTLSDLIGSLLSTRHLVATHAALPHCPLGEILIKSPLSIRIHRIRPHTR